MTPSNPRSQLSLVEAQLFASTELAVIMAIDASEDVGEAVIRLEDLGMTQGEAAFVLEMPLRRRTQAERRALFEEAERLRQAM